MNSSQTASLPTSFLNHTQLQKTHQGISVHVGREKWGEEVFIPLVFNCKMSKNKGIDTNRNKWTQCELITCNSYSAGCLHTSLELFAWWAAEVIFYDTWGVMFGLLSQTSVRQNVHWNLTPVPKLTFRIFHLTQSSWKIPQNRISVKLWNLYLIRVFWIYIYFFLNNTLNLNSMRYRIFFV